MTAFMNKHGMPCRIVRPAGYRREVAFWQPAIFNYFVNNRAGLIALAAIPRVARAYACAVRQHRTALRGLTIHELRIIAREFEDRAHHANHRQYS